MKEDKEEREEKKEKEEKGQREDKQVVDGEKKVQDGEEEVCNSGQAFDVLQVIFYVLYDGVMTKTSSLIWLTYASTFQLNFQIHKKQKQSLAGYKSSSAQSLHG